MQVVCFGDSNTYGFDPRSFFGGRYPADARWVDLLARKTGWDFKNEGMNGREIPTGRLELPENSDLLIVMLGSNDLLQGVDCKTAASRMETFLSGLDREKIKILLVAPPPMQYGAWVADQMLIDSSKQLAQAYQDISKRMGIRFADAGEWNISLTFDGVHFTEEGHRAFAKGLFRYLNKGADSYAGSGNAGTGFCTVG